MINWLHLEGDDATRAALTPEDHGAVAVADRRNRTGRRVRMGHLAFLGARTGSTACRRLHTELMRETVFRDLHAHLPADRVVNKTNGVTFRRWLHQANPGLTRAPRRQRSGRTSSTSRTRPRKSSRHFANDAAFQERFVADASPPTRSRSPRRSRDRHNIRGRSRTPIFDVQIKRIHEYKRPLLLNLHGDGSALRGDQGRAERRVGRRASRSSPARLPRATSRPSSSSSSPTISANASTPIRRCAGGSPSRSCRTTTSAWPR